MRKNRISSRGFTLIEMLVVMTISIILMGLILGPVVQSFKLTRRAQAMVDSQDAARQAMDLISRDLGQAMYVYDNAATPMELPVPDAASGTKYLPMKFAKIDFVLPKMMMHCNNPNHPEDKSRDYARDIVSDTGDKYTYAWPECPVCKAEGLDAANVEARPKLPLEQDVTIVRYFLGLANNNINDPIESGSAIINHGWVSPWHGNVQQDSENQVVLYRVEFSPSDDSLFPKDMSYEARMADGQFFYRQGYASRWKSIARVIGIGKYEDLVTATYETVSGNEAVKAVDPTITFRTSAIDNDTFAGAYSSDAAFEYPDTAPSVYNATYGYWTPNNKVNVYRDDFNTAYATKMKSDGSLWVVKFVNASGGWQETDNFNITKYLADGYVQTSYGSDPVGMGFTIDTNRGTVNFALNPPRPNGLATGPVCEIDPALVNDRFHAEYDASRSGSRQWLLPTADDTNAKQYLQNAIIVPGSERVFGPDSTPGGNPSRVVRYERVPAKLSTPGLNQYKIDYDTGWIYFSPVYNEDLPVIKDPDNSAGYLPIRVDYKVQFNRKEDIVRGDYSTKCLVTIHLGMRMFDPESGEAHPVDLTQNIKIRNALR